MAFEVGTAVEMKKKEKEREDLLFVFFCVFESRGQKAMKTAFLCPNWSKNKDTRTSIKV